MQLWKAMQICVAKGHRTRKNIMSKKTFIVSDESVNEYGFRVLTSGIRTERFKANPVMFYNHEREDGVIGKWMNLAVEDNRLKAEPEFDKDDDGLGAKISGKVERGFIRAASIGFSIVSLSEDPALMLPGQTLPTVTECELVEISIVDLPGNKNALALYDKDGKAIQLKAGADLKMFFQSNTNTEHMLKLTAKTITALKLSDNATAEQIEAAVELALNENSQLKSELKTLKDAQAKEKTDRVKQLVADALAAKKITADEVKDFEDLGMTNLAMLEKQLAKLQAPNLPANGIKPGEGKQATQTAGVKSLRELAAGKTLRELEKENSKLVLRIKREDADLYKELYLQTYGVEPKA